MSARQFKEWLRKLAEKLMGQQPATAMDRGAVFLIDREGVCYLPERKVVLRAKHGAEQQAA